MGSRPPPPLDIPLPGDPEGPYDPQQGWWARRRGPILFLVACALILFVLWWIDVIGKPPPPEPKPPPYLLIKAGTVEPLSSTGKLVGHFIVSADDRADPQVDRSFGSGGACQIADLGTYVGGDQSCTKHSDCSDKWGAYYDTIKDDPKFTAGVPAAPGVPGTAGFTKEGAGYCLSKTCWYRPYGGQCQRRPWEKDGVYFGPYPTGTHDVELASTEFLKKMYGPNANLTWKMVACANRASTSAPWKDAASCSNSDGIYDPTQE